LTSRADNAGQSEDFEARTAGRPTIRMSHMFLCVLTVLAGLSVAGMIWVLQQSRALPGVSGTATVLWAVPTVTGAESYPGQLVVQFNQPKSLTAPAWNGVITAVARPGIVVQDGTTLLSIDGISRTVCSTPAPLYRPLGLGDSGADVVELRDCLAAITGVYATPIDADDTVDKPLVAQIDMAAKMIGAPATGVFYPDWVIWASSTGWTLGRIEASIGQSAPPAGLPFALSEAGIAAAGVNIIDANSSLLKEASSAGDRLSFAAGDASISINSAGIPRRAALRRFLASRLGSEAGISGSVTISGTIDIIGPSRMEVPESALLVNEKGQSCLIARMKGQATAIPVTAIPSEDQGNVIVVGRVGAMTEVALNPYDVQGVRSLC
jgi:hypothetical protein